MKNKITLLLILLVFTIHILNGQSVTNLQVYTVSCVPGYEWDGWENDPIPCFRFSFTGSSLVATITVAGSGYSNTVQYSPGSCLAWPDELSSGIYTWTYEVFYLSGMSIISKSGSGNPFFVDVDPPNIPVVTVQEGTGSSSDNPPWTAINTPTFTWDDPGDIGSGVDHYEVSVNGGEWQEVENGWQPSLEDGSYTFNFRSVDQADLTSSSYTVFMRVDATAPVANAGSDVQITEWEEHSFDGSSSSDNFYIAEYTWHFQDGGVDQYLYGATPSYTFNNNGIYEVSLVVSDSAGNTSADTVYVTVNKTNYYVTATSGSNGTITPEGVSMVQRDNDLDFIIEPDSAYFISEVLLDDVSILNAISFSEGKGYYILAAVNANHNLHISFEPIVETWPVLSSISYGDSTGAAQLSGAVTNVEGLFNLECPDSVPDAGNFVASLSFVANDTHWCPVQYDTAVLSVEKVPLNIQAISDTIRFNGEEYSGGNGLFFDGFVNFEDSSVLSGTAEFSGSSQGAIDTGTYSIIPSGYSSENYTISYTEGPLLIFPANLVVNALDGEKIFDQSDPEFNYEIVQGELFNLDELTGVLVREEGEAVGSYQILIGDLSAGSNYSIDFNPGTFTILGRLTISSTEGGEVILPGEGIFTYSEPAEVSIIAEPVDPYHFSYWSGDTDNLSATDSSEITVLVDGDYAYTANFELSNAVETLSDDLFVIYPNPARQYVNIYLDQKASLSHSYKYQLFDMQGRLLEQGHISENNNRIGIEKYDTPMLLLKIQLGDQLIKSTIIIKE